MSNNCAILQFYQTPALTKAEVNTVLKKASSAGVSGIVSVKSEFCYYVDAKGLFTIFPRIVCNIFAPSINTHYSSCLLAIFKVNSHRKSWKRLNGFLRQTLNLNSPANQYCEHPRMDSLLRSVQDWTFPPPCPPMPVRSVRTLAWKIVLTESKSRLFIRSNSRSVL